MENKDKREIVNSIKEEIIERCKALKLSGANNIYETVSDIVNDGYDIRLSSEYIRNIVRAYRSKNNLDENFMPIMDEKEEDKTTVMQFNKDGSRTTEKLISVKEGDEITPQLLLEKHGYDYNKFILVNAKNTIRDVSRKGEKDVFYSSNITVKPANTYLWTAESIEKLFNEIKTIVPKRLYNETSSNYEVNGKQLVVPIADLHYNMLATMLNSGEEYNVKIARDNFLRVINDVKVRCKDMKIESILFPFGNDGLNSDIKHATTKGTPQDDDIDWESAVLGFTDLLVEGIEILRTIAPVEAVLIPANHDYYTMFGIANALRMYYAKADDVTVDYSPYPRKYSIFGKTLMMIAHDVKPEMINGIIQQEARDLLSDTTNTVALLAHLHTENVVDKGGTDVRRLSTLVPKSKWTAEQGYTSRSKAQAFIIDKEFGITDVWYIF